MMERESWLASRRHPRSVLRLVPSLPPEPLTPSGERVLVVAEGFRLTSERLEVAGGSWRLEELRGFRKQAGSNFGEVRYGTYASDALGAFQLYGPRLGQHWLLETPSGRVVVVPDDQEAFEAWARLMATRAP